MLDKPYQELTEMERMLLAVLTEKAEAERLAAEEAARLAAEEAERQEAERRAAEEAIRQEAERRAAEEARLKAEAEPEAEAPTESEETPPENSEPDESEPGWETLENEPAPEEEPKSVKKPGVDPALVEAISASVAARMAQNDKNVNVKDTPTVPPEKQVEEAERISRQLEQMEWIGHNRDRERNRSGWIVLLLCAVALVLGALILHSIGAIGGRPRPTPLLPEETPFESAAPDVTASAEPVESAEPTETVAPTATPEPTPTPAPKPRFELVMSNASWETAKAEAEAKGGHLAVISSAEQLQEIANLAAAQGARYVWIGLSRNGSGELQWVAENPNPYVVWASGEPSVRDSYTGQPENYVLIANNAGAWSFNDCGNDPAGAYPRFYSGVLAYVIQYD